MITNVYMKIEDLYPDLTKPIIIKEDIDDSKQEQSIQSN